MVLIVKAQYYVQLCSICNIRYDAFLCNFQAAFLKTFFFKDTTGLAFSQKISESDERSKNYFMKIENTQYSQSLIVQ